MSEGEAIVVQPVSEAFKFVVELTPHQAQELYAELYHAWDEMEEGGGIFNSSIRRRFSMLSSLYDALHSAGVPGS